MKTLVFIHLRDPEMANQLVIALDRFAPESPFQIEDAFLCERHDDGRLDYLHIIDKDQLGASNELTDFMRFLSEEHPSLPPEEYRLYPADSFCEAYEGLAPGYTAISLEVETRFPGFDEEDMVASVTSQLPGRPTIIIGKPPPTPEPPEPDSELF